MGDTEKYDADLNPRYYLVTLTMVVNAEDEQMAFDEVVRITSDGVRSFITAKKIGEGLDF